MTTVDAVIPVYGEEADGLALTIRGLVKQSLPPARIVVVDDGSPAPVDLTGCENTTELLRLEENSGISAARNRAARGSTASYLLFVNCEVALGLDWLARGVEFLETHPAAAAVGGRIEPCAGPLLFRRWRRRFLENPEQRGAEERRVPWISGHAILVRRSAFEQAGGYDIRLRLAREDYDFCNRLTALGHRIYYLPQLVAEIHESLSIDLLARKCLRNNTWDVREASSPGGTSLLTVQLLPALHSVLYSLANQAGRDLVKGRVAFLPIDFAVATRSARLVWRASRR